MAAALVMAIGALAGACDFVQGGTYSLETESSWDGRRITGVVRNTGASTVSCVTVAYALVNRQGATLHTVSTKSDDDLAPGDEWDFAIVASAAGATGTRLTKAQPC